MAIRILLGLLMGCQQDGGARGGADDWPADLPREFRQCTVDDECVVAITLAGLDHPPGPEETCKGTCYIGVNKTHLPAWERSVQALAAGVPCDTEFEECPPPERYRAFCERSRCQVK